MAGIRSERIASVLKRDLAEIFQSESRNLFGGMFITVTQVRMTPDMQLAKVYLSFMAVDDKEAALQSVMAEKGRIKKLLGQRGAKQLRKMPDLNFYIDDTLDYAQRIDELLK